MESSEKLQIDDVVALLRTWAANRLYGNITVHIDEGRIVGIRPGPYLRTATQFRRHLPEVKQWRGTRMTRPKRTAGNSPRAIRS